MVKMCAALGIASVAAAMIACGSSSASPTAPSTTATTASSTTAGSSTPSTTTQAGTSSTSSTLPAIYSRFRSAVMVSISGSTVTLVSQAVPDHRSPYWGTSHALYEAPHSGMAPNPHSIQAQTLTLRVAASPAISGMTDTPLGPIGMAINGVPLFNQYAAGRQPLTSEIVSFDRYNGHPAPSNQYHYHFEPLAITNGNTSGLVGVLLDGFPVYGPQDQGGTTPTNLDSCNGHTAATADAPAGVYHYHTTTSVPYIAGCFRGTQGSVG